MSRADEFVLVTRKVSWNEASSSGEFSSSLSMSTLLFALMLGATSLRMASRRFES